MIEVGRKHRWGTVEAVSKGEKLVALYDHWNMGKKGKILAMDAEDDPLECRPGGILHTPMDGKWFHVVEYCADHAELMRKYNWYLTSAKSAYREER